MELGQRIKAARLEAGLSQRQLCGQTITRNMLSLIENGTARPSMETLQYLAGQLGKPMGWFLGEQLPPNREAMARAREAFRHGAWEDALSALDGFKGPDPELEDEKQLLFYLASLNLAEAALQTQRLPYARYLLEQAAQASSPYITAALQCQLQLLQAKAGLEISPDGDEILLTLAGQCLEAQPQRALVLLEAARDHNAADWLWLAGRANCALGHYSLAATQLGAVEHLHPQALPLLEVCFRELGDFEKAYAYACKQRQ